MSTYALHSYQVTGGPIVTNTFDIYVVDSQLALVIDTSQVAQDIGTRLRTFLGEYFADTTFGLDFTPIWNKPIDTGYFDVLVKNIILGTKGVQEISAYSSTINTGRRQYNINVTVISLTGDNLTLALSLP